jgi:hypothetical protein
MSSNHFGVLRLIRHVALMLFGALAILAIAGCKPKPPADVLLNLKPRTDFTPADFGIGRPHTRDQACNREIDRLLNETRLCFNSHPDGGCDALQQSNSDRIGRLKNSERCQR